MITRSPRPTSNFYMLDKAISEDKRLSWPTRGLLIFLLGKPDHWTVSPAALVNETAQSSRRIGRDGVYAILKELKEVGYLHTIGNRNDGGTFAGADYVVSESPHTAFPDAVVLPHTAKPDTAGPDTANPPQVSIDSKQGLNKKEGLNIPATPAGPLAAVKLAAVKPAKAPKAPKAEKLPKVEKTDAEKALEEKKAALKEVCRQTWAAYCEAYQARYGSAPLSNEVTNSQIILLVKRIGKEAPNMARFYVSRVNDSFIAGKCHALGLLVSGYEGFYTQWVTGKTAATDQATPHKYAGAAAAIWGNDNDNDARTVNA